jgi:hypothetical protein
VNRFGWSRVGGHVDTAPLRNAKSLRCSVAATTSCPWSRPSGGARSPGQGEGVVSQQPHWYSPGSQDPPVSWCG